MLPRSIIFAVKPVEKKNLPVVPNARKVLEGGS